MTSIAGRMTALLFAAILCARAPAAFAGPPQGPPSSPPSGSGPAQGAPLDKNSVVQCKGASAAAAAAANYAISIDGGLLAGGQASGLTGTESLSNICHFYSGHTLLGGGPIFNVLRNGYNIQFRNGVVGAHANKSLLDPGAANAPFCFRVAVVQGSDLAIVAVDGAKPMPC